MSTVDLHPTTVQRELAFRSKMNRFEACHEHIPLESFVSEDFHIMALRTSDLVALYETEGIDPVCLSEEEIRSHADLLTMAYNECDSRLCIHTYFIKDRVFPERKDVTYMDSIVNAIDGARAAKLAKEEFYSTRIIYGFEWKSSFSGGQSKAAAVMPLLGRGLKAMGSKAAWKSWVEDFQKVIGGTKAIRVGERRFLEEIRDFQSALAAMTSRMEMLTLGGDVDASLAEAIGATRLEMAALRGFEAFRVLHRIWNWDPVARAHPSYPGPADELVPFLGQTGLDMRHHNVIHSGEKPIRIYTIRGFRDPVAWDVMRQIRILPCEMVIHTRFARMPEDESSAFVAGRMAKAHNLGGFVKGDPMKVKRIEDLKVAMRESVRGKPFGRWSCQVVLGGDSLENLDDICKRFEAICAGQGMLVRREEISKDDAFYSQLPGNAGYEFMTRTVQTLMAVAVNLPYRQAEGRGATPPRDCPFPEPLCSINTYDPTTQRAGLPVNLYLSVGNIAHFAIIGQSGGGKSFLWNFLETNYGRYAGTADAPVGLKRWVIDKGHSYRSLCTLLGGSYINVADPETPAKMNPFDLPPDELRRKTPILVKLLSLMMCASATTRADLTESEANALSDAIRGMARYLDDNYGRGVFGTIEQLSTFLNGTPTLQGRLKEWLPGGTYAHIFPSARDGMQNADFTVFNFEAQYVPDSILGPVFFYLLSTINTIVEDERFADWRKLCFIDETAAFITPRKGDWKSEMVTSEIRNFIRIAWKTWRKKNGVLGLASQEASDFQGDTDFWQTFRGGVPTKIFLKQKDCGRALTDPREGLGLPHHILDVVQRLPRGAFLIEAGGMRRYLVLNPDPTSYAIYTTDPIESQFRTWWLETHPFSEDYTPYQAFEDIGGHMAQAKRSGAKEAHFRQVLREYATLAEE